MGIQEVKKLLHNQQHRRHDTRVEDHSQEGAKVCVLGLSGIDGIAMPPLQQLKPVKTAVRRRHGDDSGEKERDGGGEEEGEEPVTPRGEGWRIPAEATTCPPAPKKPRTAVSIIRSGAGGPRRCNCDDDEFFRVPADLEAVFVSRAAKAN